LRRLLIELVDALGEELDFLNELLGGLDKLVTLGL
jgi:hypothetical protein